MSEGLATPSRNARPLPSWAWALAVFLFPWGVFIALGSARLISWTRSIVLAIVSSGCVTGFAKSMASLEEAHASEAIRSVALTGGVLMFCFWGYVIYRIGRDASYWSPAVQRGWRRAGWFAIALLVLSLVSMGLTITLSHLQQN